MLMTLLELRISIKFIQKESVTEAKITYVPDIKEALEGANVCFIFTEWGEIKALTPETYKKLMRTPLVYDGRNIYPSKKCRTPALNIIRSGERRV